MPIAEIGSSPVDNRHRLRVTRNDSLRSDRSDKRVSFNNDVGVKHIPRGTKNSQFKVARDEWANCEPVHLQKSKLTPEELEQQAEDLVKLLDNVNCVSHKKPITHPGFSSKSLEKYKKNKSNNIKTLNNEKNKYINDKSLNKSWNSALTDKENINNINTNNRYKEDSYQLNKLNSPYKSVPNIPTTIFYNNTKPPPNYLIDNKLYQKKNFKSVDNLNNINAEKFNRGLVNKNLNHYKSADNLADLDSPTSRRLFNYKSSPYKVLQRRPSYSSDIMMPESRPYTGYRNIHRRTDSDSSNHQVRTHKIYLEESPQQTSKDVSDYSVSNNFNRLKYKSPPLSSLEELRRISPSREIPIRREGSSYIDINKPDRRTRSSSREPERNHRFLDSDYSAKIIITGNDAKNHYDDDDHAYETYQVGGGPFAKSSRYYGITTDDNFDDYNMNMNNNMNMSSIGVQTERVPKPPQRTRRNQRIMYNLQDDDEVDTKEHLTSASLVRRINHGFGRIDRSPSPPSIKRSIPPRVSQNVVPLLSDTDESEYNYRRHVDPLAKIRNQVMIRDKVEEERESVEREEERYNRRNQRLNELNHHGLHSFTADDIDAIAQEVNKKSNNKSVTVNRNHVSQHSRDNLRSNEYENSNNNNKNSIDSRGRKLETENTKNTRERNKSPGIFSTLEKIKNNNFMSTLERNKAKEKKKKKIKIKFFYDPRPQDKPDEDPLDRYTEYKGERSDSPDMTVSQKEDDIDSPKGKWLSDFETKPEYASRSRDARRGRDIKYRYDSSESPVRSDSKPPRYSSREKSLDRVNEHTYKQRYGKEALSDRTRKDYQSSIDRRNRTNYQTNYDSSLDRRMARNNKNNLRSLSSSQESRTNVPSKTNTGVKISRNIEEPKVRNPARRLEFSDDTDHQDYSDHGKRSLSQKYKSLSRNETPPRQKTILRSSEKSDFEESDKNEKIERQRKKFFGVLMGEGKTKYPTPPRERSGERARSSEPRTATIQRNGMRQNQSVPRSTRDATPPPPGSSTVLVDKKHQSIPPAKSRKSTSWPWSFLKFKRGGVSQKTSKSQNLQQKHARPSRAPSRASSRASTPRRPTVRASKIRKDVMDGRPHVSRDREADDREKKHWERATHVRSQSSPRDVVRVREQTPLRNDRGNIGGKYSYDSSPSTPQAPSRRVGRAPSFQERYLSDKDSERGGSRGRNVTTTNNLTGNYQSLPNRKNRSHSSSQNVAPRRPGAIRKPSPIARGSAGSSLQSSESEADSHGGSHASRASHISTGSNRSVYLHATAVADIPVRRSSDESPSERGVTRQSRKVARSFSLVSPWKPRHYRDKYEVEYDNREARDGVDSRAPPPPRDEKKNALPPRPPRKPAEAEDSPKKMARSQTVYKDSKLAGWLKRRKNKEIKGI